jgi:immune inhibitor A
MPEGSYFVRFLRRSPRRRSGVTRTQEKFVKRRTLRVLTGVAVTALAVSIVQVPAQAAPASTDRDPAVAQATKSDDLKSPLSEKQRQLRETAVKQVVKGTAKVETKGGQSVINMGKGSTSSTPSIARSRSSRSSPTSAP